MSIPRTLGRLVPRPGSGTGGLRGIRGSGTDVAMVAEAPHVRLTLRYRFS